jgi:hypothetical protein
VSDRRTLDLIEPGANPPLPPQPDWRDDVPWCFPEGDLGAGLNCPHYDGKRCDLLGHDPEDICEPAVQEFVRAANKKKEP